MYELDENQILLVSGGDAVLITEEWKQNLYYKGMLIDSLGLGMTTCVCFLFQYGFTVEYGIGGLVTGALLGAIYGLHQAYNINSTLETGTWHTFE